MKGISIAFLLLANFIILAHAVIPHHHHESLVCINFNHCQDDSDEHQHNTPEHSHDDNNSSDCCILNQVLVFPANTVRQESNCVVSNDFHPSIANVLAISSIQRLIVLDTIFYKKMPDPFIRSFYTIFSITSFGLRAPPIA